MKKLMTLTAAAILVSTAPAMAEDHGGEGHKGPKGGMFEKHDTNGDGVVSKDEFLAHAEEKFSKMDKDGNGEISKEEGAEAHKNMKEKVKERMKERKERRDERKDAAE